MKCRLNLMEVMGGFLLHESNCRMQDRLTDPLQIRIGFSALRLLQQPIHYSASARVAVRMHLSTDQKPNSNYNCNRSKVVN